MNKICLHIGVAALTAGLPFVACAQDITTPPIYVTPLSGELKASQNTAPDSQTRQDFLKRLIAQNAALTIQVDVLLDQVVDVSATVGQMRDPKLKALTAALAQKDGLINTEFELAQAREAELNNLKRDLQSTRDQLNAIKEQNEAGAKKTEIQVKDTGGQNQVELDKIKASLMEKDQQISALKDQLEKSSQQQKAPAPSEPVAVQKPAVTEPTDDKLTASLKEVEKLNSQISKDDKAFETIRKNGLILRSQLDEKNTDLSKAQERMRLWEQLSGLRRQHIVLLQQKKTELNQDTTGSLQRKIENLQDQIEVLKKQSAAKQAERDDVYHLLQRYKNQINENTNSAGQQDTRLNDYRSRQDELQQQLRQAQDDLKAKEMEIDSLKQDVGRLNKEASEETQSKALAQQVAQDKRSEKDKKELADLRDQLSAAEAKLKEADRSVELDRLKDMLKSSREEIVLLNNALKLREEEIAKLQKPQTNEGRELAKSRQQVEKLQAQLAKDDEEFAAIRKNNTALTGGMKEDLEWKDKQIARLKMQLKGRGITPAVENKEGDYQHLRQSLKDAKEQVAALKEKLRQRLQNAFQNDPEYKHMSDQVKALKEGAVELIKNNADCQAQLSRQSRSSN